MVGRIYIWIHRGLLVLVGRRAFGVGAVLGLVASTASAEFQAVDSANLQSANYHLSLIAPDIDDIRGYASHLYDIKLWVENNAALLDDIRVQALTQTTHQGAILDELEWQSTLDVSRNSRLIEIRDSLAEIETSIGESGPTSTAPANPTVSTANPTLGGASVDLADVSYGSALHDMDVTPQADPAAVTLAGAPGQSSWSIPINTASLGGVFGLSGASYTLSVDATHIPAAVITVIHSIIIAFASWFWGWRVFDEFKRQ